MAAWPFPRPDYHFAWEYADHPGVRQVQLVTLAGFIALGLFAFTQSVCFGVLVFGPSIAAAVHLTHKYVTEERIESVTLTPDEFRVAWVHGVVRRSRRIAAYRWEQVRATYFDVFTSKGDVGYSASPRAWLIVDVERGKEALRLDTRFVGFDDLLAVFNTMTIHLPYQWERHTPDRFTYSTSYRKVMRAEAVETGHVA